MSEVPKKSLVQYVDLSKRPGHCGYCGSSGSVSQGLWLERLRVQDYQDMLDRGWRRSGRYVYKPSMEVTCCPLYTIRCSANEFQPSRSQKKVARRVVNFLQSGAKVGIPESGSTSQKSSNVIENKKNEYVEKSSDLSQFRRIEGLKKAKIRRGERKMEKRAKLGLEDLEEVQIKIPHNLPKTLSDLFPSENYYSLNQKVVQKLDADAKHKFSLRLVKANLRDLEFMDSFYESYNVFHKYQTIIHKESEDECDMQAFATFLCDSPLIYESKKGEDQEVLLGAFHQQYLVDGKIVAVAVIDILPYCVSSVYFYYDPRFWGQANLSPGTYSALREVQLTQQLGTLLPDLQYYYMGYYVHSCPKMTYKGKFLPSELLSPTLESWHPLSPCAELLDKNKFSTFSEVAASSPAPLKKISDISRVNLIVKGEEMNVEDAKKTLGENERSLDLVTEYHQLLGQHLGEVLVLVLDDTESDQSSSSD